MRISALFTTWALLGSAWMLNLSAATVETDPVGAMAITLLGNSDTVVSIPFHRPIEFEGKIQSIANGAEGSDSAVITVTTSPGWTPNQFVYNGDAQPNTYYVLVASGQNEGMYYTVTANGSNTLTIDTAGDDLSGIQSDSQHGSGMGDIIRLIPYWTLDTLFPEGRGLHVTTIHGDRPSEVLFPDYSKKGTNLTASEAYYYYSGTLPGWRKVGGGLNTLFNNVVIPPDHVLIIRNNVPESTTLVSSGAVLMSSYSTILANVDPASKQDVYVGVSVPVGVSLKDSGLGGSPAFKTSTSHGVRADELLVFDNTVAQKNKSSSKIYYYFDNGGPNPGWREVGAGLNVIKDDELVFQPGQGVVIRRDVRDSDPNESVWAFTPPYLQE